MRADDVLVRLKCPCCQESKLDPRLVPLLVRLEEKTGKNLSITSGFRCKKHNQDLINKGFPASFTSRHMLGDAVDIFCMKKNQPDMIQAARELGFNGVGIGKNFLHFDLRELPAEWWY